MVGKASCDLIKNFGSLAGIVYGTSLMGYYRQTQQLTDIIKKIQNIRIYYDNIFKFPLAILRHELTVNHLKSSSKKKYTYYWILNIKKNAQ